MASLRILLVDDNEVVRRGIRTMLAGHPCLSVCGEAVDGIDAIEKSRELRPDAVLMDISMPRMDGLEATRAIRRELPETKVVLVSQNDPISVRRQVKNVDAHDSVAKVDIPQALLATLERLFNGRMNVPKEEVDRKPDLRAAIPLANSHTWLAGGGEMGAVMRATDWSKTPLGPLDLWSPALRMMVKFLLANRFPQLLWWGPQFCCLYNDAYIPILGGKHPWAVGQPVSTVWHEIWHVLQPLIETPYRGGPATWMEDIPLEINRRGFVEETHFTIAYSPVPDDTVPSGIGGVLATVHEITEKVIGERRVTALRDLGARSVEPKSAEEACTIAAESIARHSRDVPFVLFYLFDADRSTARLICGAGANLRDRGCPKTIDLKDVSSSSAWPVAEALEMEKIAFVENLKDKFEVTPQGPWPDPPYTAVVVPIHSAISHQFAGFMIAGISSRIAFDAAYRDFLHLMSTQVATSIGSARAYEEERKRAEALAEIDRVKTAFFGNVSHEFRTPLTLMLGPLQDLLARSQADLSLSARHQLELVNRNGGRLLRLVNTLLDFSRIEAGRAQAVYQATDLASLTGELASVFRSATERAGLRLVVDCRDLGEPVYVDRDMWEKIVLNLVSNAFKFTFEGEIAVTVGRSGANAELRVRDTGVGIPAEAMPKIFERFHRVPDTRSRTYEGSGIGLALVQELVRLHGGFVQVESALGQGSTFIVSVPFGQNHLPTGQIGGSRSLCSTAIDAQMFAEEALRSLPDVAPAAQAAQILASQQEFPPSANVVLSDATVGPMARVLVADDNSDMRQYLARLFSDSYAVETVGDGRAALAAAREQRPDLILSDAMMPRLDGLGLLRELRADPSLREIPIILLSARAGEESRLEGVAAGADDYLVKPFSARELRARVEGHIKMHRLRQEAKLSQQHLAAEYETLLNRAPMGIYVIDESFCVRQINPVAMPRFADVPNPIGRNFEEVARILMPAERAEEIVRVFRHTLKTGEPYEMPEERSHMHSGATTYYKWRVDRIPLPDGTDGIVVYFHDISAIVHGREAIAESEERLRLAAEAAELGIWSWYPMEDRTTWENERLFEIFGRSSKDGPIGFSELASSMLHPQDAEPFRRALMKALETRSRFFYEARLQRADGQMRWLEFTGRLQRRAQGSVQRMLGTVLDITERKKGEEREQHITSVVRQADLLRDFSQRLLQMQDEERRRIARELHDSSGQLLTVLGIQESRISERLKKRDFSDFDGLLRDMEEVQSLTHQLNSELRTTSYLLHPPMLDEMGIAGALQWYVEGFNARSGIDVRVEIDNKFGRLQPEIELATFRIVQEALTNIRRHSGAKQGAIRIARHPGEVRIEIRDSGKGISAEKLNEIRSGGAGVGHRGMRERVHQLHGQIAIHSDETGTQLFVTFPVSTAPSPQAPPLEFQEFHGEIN